MKKNCWIFHLWELVFAGILVLGLMVPQLHAQVDTGTILGTVKDQTGAVIPNAKVTLTNPATSYTITTKTGPDGSYVFTPIRIGTYDVTVEDTGFQKTTHTGITVNIQQQVVVNVVMMPGKVTQTVQVTGAVPLLQTQNASIQQVVASREINDLPLNGRNASFLARLAAGVTPAHDAGRGLQASGSFSANGAQTLQNNYMVDGIDDNAEIGDMINRTSYVVMPPPDALDEFTVQTSNYSAEFGHSAGAVLNATTKAGTNQLHGDLWEFVRNDKFDATPFFLNAAGAKKAEYRQNQFGGTIGGPIVIPHVYNGRNKAFFFGWYQGTRIREGSTVVTSVPTAAERNSGYTNFQDLITGQSGTRTDALGRTFPLGTIMDPATTRPVTAGVVDPVTGLMPTASGYVRDPFYQGSLVNVTNFTSSTAEGLLNMIPQGRLDPNAIKLLNLYPSPTASSLFSNYTAAPVNMDDNDEGGFRVDYDISAKDTTFFRYIQSNTTNAFPGPFPGLADGQPNRPGSGVTTAKNFALSWTHIFSSSLINEARIGYSRLHDVRLQYEGSNLTNIPAKFGIQGIPQVAENGGLPRIDIGSLTSMGTAQFLPSDKWGNTLQATENLTKVVGHHTIKAGVELQNIRFPMLVPPHSRGEFGYNGVFTSVVNETDGSTGPAQFLLTPIASTVAGGIDNVGGMNSLAADNFRPMAALRRSYYGIYAQDDWRTTPNLTLNLGLRWDYFGRPTEHFNSITNLIPNLDFKGGRYLIAASRKGEVPQGFINQLQLNGVTFEPTTGTVWQNSGTRDFGPRFGFAYHPMSNLVVRGGYAIFYGGFTNLGLSDYGDNNFPFLIISNFSNPNAVTPITPDNSVGTLENGLVNVPLTATASGNYSGIVSHSTAPNWKDAASQNYNFSLEYELLKETTLKVGYVGSVTHHLQQANSLNTVAQILPPGTNLQQYVFYPQLGRGGSYLYPAGDANYNSLQVNLEHRAHNLFMLANFTWAKCRTDTSEALIGGGSGQAPYLAGFGPQYETCIDGGAAKVFHYSGLYSLPFGHGQRFLNETGIVNQVVGGWETNWIFTAQDGEPFTIGCNISTTAGLGCNALLVPGQNPYQGQTTPGRFLNAAAFANPPVATTIGQTNFAPLGGAETQVTGPRYLDLDFSVFKNFQTTEKTHLQFRAEFFNLTNSPSFSNPSHTNFADTAHFGEITGTVSSPREIQLALKFFF